MTMTISGSGTITGLTAGGLPDATITQAEIATPVAGTGPAFSAYQGSSQVLTSATWNVVTINTEVFDTNSNFNTTTYAFTPTVAGYYHLNGTFQTYSGTNIAVGIIKNGTIFQSGSISSSPNINSTAIISTIIYLNGTTDSVQLGAYSDVSATSYNGSIQTWFNGCLIRSA